MIQLTLPLPPSANRYWRVVRGRPILSKAAREYRKKCRLAAVAQHGGDPVAGRVRIKADVFMDLRGDLMNREKQLLDALQGAVIVDDAQVWDMRMVRHLDRASPRVELRLAEIGESQESFL